MDFFSHGLWTIAIYAAANGKLNPVRKEAQEGVSSSHSFFRLRGGLSNGVKKTFNLRLAGFWGVFPDTFTYALGVVWFFLNYISGGSQTLQVPPPGEIEPVPPDSFSIFRHVQLLYSVSHSLVVFFLFFVFLFAVARRFSPVFLGWFIHIFLDVPTHTYQFYPTPIFWPLSDWKFSGISWATPQFLILNYSAIIIVYLLLYKSRKK